MNPSSHNTQIPNPKYAFARAARPFSLPVALVTCATGAALIFHQPAFDWTFALLAVAAALLLQLGVNLINDRADLTTSELRDDLSKEDRHRIQRNFFCGMLSMAFAGSIGLLLIYQTGMFLAILVVVGALGALGYTQEPIHYKRRGWGIPAVFLLMGVLMIYGTAYVASGGHHHPEVIPASIPLSLLTSSLLLANEIRDFDADKRQGLRTLTTRIGHPRALLLFRLLLGSAYAWHLIFWLPKSPASGWLVLVSLPILAKLWSPPLENAQNLLRLPPMTGRLYLAFGFLAIIPALAST